MEEKTVILKADVEKYLSLQSQYRLKMMVDAINVGRKSDGKDPIETIEVRDYEYDPFMNRGRF